MLKSGESWNLTSASPGFSPGKPSISQIFQSRDATSRAPECVFVFYCSLTTNISEKYISMETDNQESCLGTCRLSTYICRRQGLKMLEVERAGAAERGGTTEPGGATAFDLRRARFPSHQTSFSLLYLFPRASFPLFDLIFRVSIKRDVHSSISTHHLFCQQFSGRRGM